MWSTILLINVDDKILLIVFQQYAFLDKQVDKFLYYVRKEDEVHLLLQIASVQLCVVQGKNGDG